MSAFNDDDFCFTYIMEKNGNLAFYTGISLGISIVNVVIIKLNEFLIRKIGFHYQG